MTPLAYGLEALLVACLMGFSAVWWHSYQNGDSTRLTPILWLVSAGLVGVLLYNVLPAGCTS